MRRDETGSDRLADILLFEAHCVSEVVKIEKLAGSGSVWFCPGAKLALFVLLARLADILLGIRPSWPRLSSPKSGIGASSVQSNPIRFSWACFSLAHLAESELRSRVVHKCCQKAAKQMRLNLVKLPRAPFVAHLPAQLFSSQLSSERRQHCQLLFSTASFWRASARIRARARARARA